MGDLLIALESKDIKNFYTQNYKESDFLTEVLNQTLIIRSNNYAKDDIFTNR